MRARRHLSRHGGAADGIARVRGRRDAAVRTGGLPTRRRLNNLPHIAAHGKNAPMNGVMAA